MQLINVETLRLEEFPANPPAYAILSHTWGSKNDEVLYIDIKTNGLAGCPEKAGKLKIEGCCRQAKEDGLEYAWIDTCCIDKDSAVELGEAINSMFRWYQAASTCYVYLADVRTDSSSVEPGSAFFNSRWFKRGWTLQELLAPPDVHFYDQSWVYIADKQDIAGEIETITGISRQFLLEVDAVKGASVAQRMSWAAHRATAREEDLAYCLLGLFGVHLPLIYGEGGKNAFVRLQQVVMEKTSDTSIFAWGLGSRIAPTSPSGSLPDGKATAPVSNGIWASSPSDFANCGSIVLRRPTHETVHSISGGRLRINLALKKSVLHRNTTGTFVYGLLNCGPEKDTQVDVGMPLFMPPSSELSAVEYFRPRGHVPVYIHKMGMPTTRSSASIHIQTEANTSELATTRQQWFGLMHEKKCLTFVDKHPEDVWRGSSAKMPGMDDADLVGPRKCKRYLVRFRSNLEDGLKDIVAVLNFTQFEKGLRLRCSLMVLHRETSLANLADRLPDMRAEAFANQGVRIGRLVVAATVGKGTPGTVLTLHVVSTLKKPGTAVDAELEMKNADAKRDVLRLWSTEDDLRSAIERMAQQTNKIEKTIRETHTRLARVNAQPQRLENERDLLEETAHRLSQELSNCKEKHAAVTEQYSRYLHDVADRLHGINLLEKENGPGNWLAVMLSTSHPDSASCDVCRKFYSDAAVDVENKTLSAKLGPSGESAEMTGQEPLFWAVNHGKVAEARSLIKKGADPNALLGCQLRPLLTNAVLIGDRAMVELLINEGAFVDQKDSIDGLTPLGHAVIQRNESIVRLLVEEGRANVQGQWQHQGRGQNQDQDKSKACGKTPLEQAVELDLHTIVRLLVHNGANVNTQDINGATPLINAAVRDSLPSVKLLLEIGGNIEAKQADGCTALMVAAVAGHVKVLQLLLRKGADPHTKNTRLGSALVQAATNGHEVAVGLLLDHGALIDSTDVTDNTPLTAAARTGHAGVVRVLLKRGALIEKCAEDGLTPLILASARGHKTAVELLISHGASISAEEIFPALEIALVNGHADVVGFLLSKATEGEAWVDGEALPYCLQHKDTAMIKVLLKYSAPAQVNGGHPQLLEPLMAAIHMGYADAVEVLLEKGAPCNKPCTGIWANWTPLTYAAKGGNESIVGMLLAHGAGVDKKLYTGYSPLFYAARHNHEAVVLRLLRNGADPYLRLHIRNSPLKEARRKGHTEVVSVIEHFTGRHSIL